METPELTGRQRKFLRGLAHPLKPVVQVGNEGISEALVRHVASVLDDHELIKVRFVRGDEDRVARAAELARLVGAQLAGVIGFVAIIYRRHRDPARVVIVLPDPTG
jgi:RNA-binding protein